MLPILNEAGEEICLKSDEHFCLTCGACCFSDTPRYVRVDGDDYERLGESADSYVIFHENRAFLVMIQGRCKALKKDDKTHLFFCDIYEKRPRTCRELKLGSASCLGERHMKLAKSKAAFL